jgi:hypothetical protein
MRRSLLAMYAPYLALGHPLHHLDQISPSSSAHHRGRIWQRWGCHQSNAALSKITVAERVLRQAQQDEHQERDPREEVVFIDQDHPRTVQLPIRASSNKHHSQLVYRVTLGL